MFRTVAIIIVFIFCCISPSAKECNAETNCSYLTESLSSKSANIYADIYSNDDQEKDRDLQDTIISTWQEYNWFIILLFIALVLIIILSYQLIATRSQNNDILLKLSARYNHIKNLESDTALLSNILNAVNGKSWVINLDKEEIYYINGDNSDITVVTGNNLKSHFTNFIHPDYQSQFIAKLNSCKERQSKDFDITFPIHRKHAKREYEWYWSRGIVTSRRDITGKPYLALSGITMNIEKMKRTQIDLEGSKAEMKELKDYCRQVRFEIAREINDAIRTRKKLARSLADEGLTSKERKNTYKQLREYDKKINDFIAKIHKSLK